jgi:hypothetical protein
MITALEELHAVTIPRIGSARDRSSSCSLWLAKPWYLKRRRPKCRKFTGNYINRTYAPLEAAPLAATIDAACSSS